jgi:hypothetical protein
MAAPKGRSIKHLKINKNQSSMMIVIAATVVITIFGLFAFKALVVKGLYQRRVLNARRHVVDQLKANYDSAQTLVGQYKVFDTADPNVLGGTRDGGDNLDGDNPRIVLDALPSNYDAPALATSLEKILTGRTIVINNMSVTDDPATFNDKPQVNPVAQIVPISFDGTTSFKGAQLLLQDFERSIRPFDISVLSISGTDSQLSLTANMTTNFQPAKSLNLTPTQEVK